MKKIILSISRSSDVGHRVSTCIDGGVWLDTQWICSSYSDNWIDGKS